MSLVSKNYNSLYLWMLVKSCIMHATQYGQIYIYSVKLLLQDDRVDPSADNNWTIELASQNGHTEVERIFYRIKN